MADKWYNSTLAQTLMGPGHIEGVALSGASGDTFWSGVGDYFSKWDPVFLGPIIDGFRAEDRADAMEAELGPLPEYQVPESYDRYTQMMRDRAQQQMPGYETMQEDIMGQSAANATGVGQLSSGPEAVMGTGLAYQDASNQLQDLGLRAATYKQGNQQAYAGAVQGRSPYETMEYEYNQWIPWQIGMNEAMSMRNAGMGAQQSGSDTMGAAAMTGLSMINS